MIQTLAGVSIAVFMLAGIGLAVVVGGEAMEGKIVRRPVGVAVLVITALMVATIAANAILEVAK